MNKQSRREFLKTTAVAASASSLGVFHGSGLVAASATDTLFKQFCDPPREYTLIPFWFLNDDLNKDELRRQLDDFAAHGVYGVVPHARMGLAEEFAFMSEPWLDMLQCIVEHAAKQDMKIILYDEGMYPSGSCAGQVVAANPLHATRALERRRRGEPTAGEELVYQDEKWMYVNTRSMGKIRGVHYGMDDGEPGAPPSADILNPEAVASFLHLTHDKHYEVLGEHFGKTILAIFTDEPSVLGRGSKRGVKPWTWEFEKYLEDFLGYDFRPHLSALWEDDTPETSRYKKDFDRAVNARLEEVYYKQYSDWCDAHHIEMTGHPAGSMDMGTLKHFQLPGQDVVWRYLEPFQEKSLEGEHSTMGKCSSSAKVNYGRSRNLNECFGAYGWEFTWEEMRWLTDWLLVRGVDLLSPHAFYYSVRGDRRNERPPDVGPNNVWWDRYKPYADYCRRISWMNAVGKQVCDIAILATATQLPWRAACVLFEHQRDFNYLDGDTLLTKAQVTSEGILLGDMQYKALVIDGTDTVEPGVLDALQPLLAAGGVLAYRDVPDGISGPALQADTLLEKLSSLTAPDLVLDPPHPDIRYRHVVIEGSHLYFITNEGKETVETGVRTNSQGTAVWWNPEAPGVLKEEPADRLQISPYQSRVLFTGTI